MTTCDHPDTRCLGWHFILLNLMLGLAHIVVLFNAGSYVALEPHAVGNLGGVLHSFGRWAQMNFMIALDRRFPPPSLSSIATQRPFRRENLSFV